MLRGISRFPVSAQVVFYGAAGTSAVLSGQPPPPAPPAEIEADRHALVALYIATDGANWVRNEGWLTDQPLSTWRGVFTNPEGRVSRLELQVNQLTGPIPPGLRRLASLEALRLSNNQLEGPIPSWLGELSDLMQLG